jgi:hypothetical protein
MLNYTNFSTLNKFQTEDKCLPPPFFKIYCSSLPKLPFVVRPHSTLLTVNNLAEGNYIIVFTVHSCAVHYKLAPPANVASTLVGVRSPSPYKSDSRQLTSNPSRVGCWCDTSENYTGVRLLAPALHTPIKAIWKFIWNTLCHNFGHLIIIHNPS